MARPLRKIEHAPPQTGLVKAGIELRIQPRVAASIRALCFAHGRYSTVRIVNLSIGGAALKGVGSLMANDAVAIELLDKRVLRGKVRWWLMGACGIQFDAPLPECDPLLAPRGGPAETEKV